MSLFLFDSMVDKGASGGLPKYWPILYVVYRLKRVYSSFDLQKYLYLAKVEGNAPIEYVFVNDYCGPRCASIKQDAISLGARGLSLIHISEPTRPY